MRNPFLDGYHLPQENVLAASLKGWQVEASNFVNVMKRQIHLKWVIVDSFQKMSDL